jgi:HlyD family secretion protein
MAAAGSAGSAVPPVAATPVEIGTVELGSPRAEIAAPGRTMTLVEQRVRAPFDGTVSALAVMEGDRVRKDQLIGEIVARDSEAALRGAQVMARRAASPEERADAERALELARRNLVSAPLSCPDRGTVIDRSAAVGDRVGAGQELLVVATADSLVFRAEVPQGELHRLRPGQAVLVDLAGARSPQSGRVHGMLTPTDPGGLTAPVRIDFAAPQAVPAAGLYGTARIVVEEHADVPTVPAAAVLHDDLEGTARVATVDIQDHLAWVEVETGLESEGRVELLTPRVAVGTRVVVAGQIGLQDGAPLAIGP